MKIGPEAVMVPSSCTACGTPLDRATGVDTDDNPNPGDVTICFRCGHIMAFATDLTMRELTDTEAKEVAGNKTILAIQRARGKVWQ